MARRAVAIKKALFVSSSLPLEVNCSGKEYCHGPKSSRRNVRQICRTDGRSIYSSGRSRRLQTYWASFTAWRSFSDFLADS
jgi:hypothetical protein